MVQRHKMLIKLKLTIYGVDTMEQLNMLGVKSNPLRICNRMIKRPAKETGDKKMTQNSTETPKRTEELLKKAYKE